MNLYRGYDTYLEKPKVKKILETAIDPKCSFSF